MSSRRWGRKSSPAPPTASSATRPGRKTDLGKLKFPHLEDNSHQISRAYGVLIEEKGFALRGTFIIDPEGNLKHSTVNDTAVGRNVEETIRTLAAFETGKLTGCGWTPGAKTLN